MGGASVVQQYVRANLLDEIQVHLVPILIGGGIRRFEQIGTENLEWETIRVIEAPGVTHLRFRVVH